MTATRGGVDRRGDWDAEVWRQEGVARRRRKALLQRAVGDPRGDEAILASRDSCPPSRDGAKVDEEREGAF
jgi:hypothetical protein